MSTTVATSTNTAAVQSCLKCNSLLFRGTEPDTEPDTEPAAAPGQIGEYRTCRRGFDGTPICPNGHHTVERCPIQDGQNGLSDVTLHYPPSGDPHTKKVAPGNLCYHVETLEVLLRDIAVSRRIKLSEVSTDQDTVMVRLAILVSDLNAHFGLPELLIEDTSASNRPDHNGIRAHCSRILEFFGLPRNNDYCEGCKIVDFSLDAKHTIEQLTRMS